MGLPLGLRYALRTRNSTHVRSFNLPTEARLEIECRNLQNIRLELQLLMTTAEKHNFSVCKSNSHVSPNVQRRARAVFSFIINLIYLALVHIQLLRRIGCGRVLELRARKGSGSGPK